MQGGCHEDKSVWIVNDTEKKDCKVRILAALKYHKKEATEAEAKYLKKRLKQAIRRTFDTYKRFEIVKSDSEHYNIHGELRG